MGKKVIKHLAQTLGFYRTIKPSFFILGVQKCGTSYLFNLLKEQTTISSPYKKELDYFSSDLNYTKGEDWYLKHFYFRLPCKVTFESCPNYLYSLNSHQRIFDYDPNTKLIILLRNPVERAFSAWNMYQDIWTTRKEHIINNYYLALNKTQREQGIEFLNQKKFPSFITAIEKEMEIIKDNSFTTFEPGFISRGLYYEQIKHLLSIFKKEQILIIENNELKKTNILIPKLEAFLNLSIKNTKLEKKLWFKGEYNKTIDHESKHILEQYFKPKNEQLFELIQEKFLWST